MARYGFAVVHGRSMAPTLHDGDRLVVRYGGTPDPGQVVVVWLPERHVLSVKRATHRVPEGWWVERDNPDEGVDSWLVGAVRERDVVAVALARVWPQPRWLVRPSPDQLR